MTRTVFLWRWLFLTFAFIVGAVSEPGRVRAGIPSDPPVLVTPADGSTVASTAGPVGLRRVAFAMQLSSPTLGHSWEVYRQDNGMVVRNGVLGAGVATFSVDFNAGFAGVLLCWKARVDLPMSPFSIPACFRFTAGGTPTPTPSPTLTPTVAGMDDTGALLGKTARAARR